MARAALGVLEWGMDRSPFCAPGRAVLQDKHVTVSHVDLKEHLEPVQAKAREDTCLPLPLWPRLLGTGPQQRGRQQPFPHRVETITTGLPEDRVWTDLRANENSLQMSPHSRKAQPS